MVNKAVALVHNTILNARSKPRNQPSQLLHTPLATLTNLLLRALRHHDVLLAHIVVDGGHVPAKSPGHLNNRENGEVKVVKIAVRYKRKICTICV